MGDWPLLGDGQRFEAAGAVSSAASRATVVTAGSPAHTKGSWTQLLASTAFPASGLILYVIGGSGNDTEYLLDIGIGAAASEQALVPNLMMSTGIGGAMSNWSHWPIPVPAGSRLSARCQCRTASVTLRVMCMLLGYGMKPSSPLGLVSAYGSDTADSGGVSVDPGAVANTKGVWSVLSSSTTAPIRSLVVTVGKDGNLALTNCAWLFDIGVGSSGQEQVIVPNLPVQGNSSTNVNSLTTPCWPTVPTDIPAGSRLVARAQCSITDATDRLLDVAAYGVS